MNRSRYEALPDSSPSHPPILLNLILSNHPFYNYNSGTPTSVPSSHRPSVTSISSRTPPSFHSSQLAYLNNPPSSLSRFSNFSNTPNHPRNQTATGTTPFPPFNPHSPPPYSHSRSSTPRPTPSTRTLASNFSNLSGGSAVDLWGVATTPSGGTEHDGDGDEERDGAGGLRIVKRLESLEENVGRLLLVNEELRSLRVVSATAGNESQGNRQKYCVMFTDESRDMEEVLVMHGHNNCCVRANSSASSTDRKWRKKEWFMAIVFMTILLTFFVVAANGYVRGARGGIFAGRGRERERGRSDENGGVGSGGTGK